MPVRIIVDSASDMSSSGHPQLTVLPLSVVFGQDVYLDGVTITNDRFYELLTEGDDLPSTGQVNPYAFSQAYEEAIAAGEDIVVITLSEKLSGTHQSAVTAAGLVDAKVRIVDTHSVTVGERALTEYALRLLDEGASADEIVAALEAVRDRVVVLGLLDTLEFLRRGGRISAAAGAVGEILSIKPVITVADGAVELVGKARGQKHGRNLLRKAVERTGVDFSMPLVLGYSGVSDALLRDYIEAHRDLWEAYPGDELPVHSVGATIGTHVGPGAIALAFFAQE